MQTIQNNPTDHPNLLALTSLHPAEFMKLLAVFDPLCRNYFQYHDRAANRLEGNPRCIPKFQDEAHCSLPGSAEKLLFILIIIPQIDTTEGKEIKNYNEAEQRGESDLVSAGLAIKMSVWSSDIYPTSLGKDIYKFRFKEESNR